MDTNRYYFSNVIEDEALSILAVQAKELMQQNDETVKMFRINNQILCSTHPGDVLTFMKDINKSMFSLDSSNENGINLVQSYKRPSSPKRLDPDEEAEKEKNRSATLEFSTPIRRQKIKAQPAVKATLNLTMDKTGTSDGQITSLVGSPGKLESFRSAQMTTNLTMAEKEFESPKKVVGSVEESSQESPRSAQIAKLTANLTMDEKELDSPKKVVGSVEAISQESPRSAQIAKMTANLTMDEKEFESPKKVVGSVEASSQESPRPSAILQTTPNLSMAVKESKSPAKEVRNIKQGNQKSPRSSVITMLTSSSTSASKRKNEESLQCAEKPGMSSLRVHKKSGSLVEDKQMARYSDTHTDSPNAVNPDSHSKYHAEGRKISKPAITESEVPSPVKKSKISSIPTVDIQALSSSAKKDRMAENPPENTQLAASPIVDAKLNISPIETIKGIAREDRKRKSLSPTRRFKSGTQESPQSAELTSLAVDDKETKNLIQDEQQAGISATNKDSPNPEENPGKAENPDLSNKYFISPAEGIETSEPFLIASETPSPVKKSKICSIPTVDIQELSSPAENVGMAEKSLEDTEVTLSRTPSDKLNTFVNEKVEKLARDDRKRQSFSPKKRTKTLFESIPKVIKLAGKEEIDIEVVDLEYNASPTTPRSKSADYRSDSTKDSSIKSPVQGESKAESSPKTPEHSSETDRSGKPEVDSEDIKTKNLSLTEAILEFCIVLDKRDKRVKKLFITFLSFQSSVNFIKAYVFNVSSIFLQLDISGKYTEEEFKATVYNANVVTMKLINKIKSWKRDIELDADTWHKCFQQIEQLKAKYEPLFTNEGEPAVTFEVVQRYESEMRAIWKKMGNMIILGDSKRAAFSYIAHDMERLIKMLVKCLILVGILLPR